MGNQWKQWQTILLGSKITAVGVCSPEIKMLLPLGRKAMTNLDSISKSWHVTLPTKVLPSQSYGFSSSHVWMQELDYKEIWVLKNWCFWTVVLEKTLENPLDCRKIQPVNPKGNQSWLLIGRNDAEAEAPIVWPPGAKSWLIGKDPDSGKDWRQEEKRMTEDEMVEWHHWLNVYEFEQALRVGDKQGSLACCSSWGGKESDTTEQLNWTESICSKMVKDYNGKASSFRVELMIKCFLNQLDSVKAHYDHVSQKQYTENAVMFLCHWCKKCTTSIQWQESIIRQPMLRDILWNNWPDLFKSMRSKGG